MNATRELFRKTSHFFARFPILWVPVLLADLLRTLIGTFVPQLTRGALLAAAPKSALGGIAALPKPATIAAISSGIGFAATALGLLLYLYALGIVARALVKSTQHPSWRPTLNFEFPRGIWPAWLQVCGLAALFALLSAIVISWIVRSGLKGGAFQFCVFAVIIPLIAVLLYPAMLVLRRYVLKVQTGVAYEAWPRLPYYLLVFAAVLCSNLAGTAIAFATRRSAGGPNIQQGFGFLLLQILASAATAFPYAYAMTGLSLNALAGNAGAGDAEAESAGLSRADEANL